MDYKSTAITGEIFPEVEKTLAFSDVQKSTFDANKLIPFLASVLTFNAVTYTTPSTQNLPIVDASIPRSYSVVRQMSFERYLKNNYYSFITNRGASDDDIMYRD